MLDNNLAGVLTGSEAAPTIKAAQPDCRIVLYTASTSHADASCTGLGVDAVVSKTSPMAELEETVLRLAGAARA